METPCSVFRCTLAILLLFTSCVAGAGELRVGAARVEITPKNGTPMGGYYKFRGVGGVQDPLFAKTIVIEQDGAHAPLVVLDLSGTTRPVVAAARKLIQDQCGIEPFFAANSRLHAAA